VCPNDIHPAGGPCCQGCECDMWTPHNLGPTGSMNDVPHRPYQAAVEFLCDIANTPADFVPLTVREVAAADADVFGVNDFVNGPMPGCFAIDFGLHFGTCSNSANACDQATPCTGANQGCNPQTGCCVTLSTNMNAQVVSGALQTQTGPNICAQITGFQPNELVDIQLVGVPGLPTYPNPYDRGVYQVDATGAFYWDDGEFNMAFQFCSMMDMSLSTTISVTSVINPMVTAMGTVPNGFLCGNDSGSFGINCH